MKRIILTNIFPFIVLILLSGVSVNACWCRNDPEETNTQEKFSKTVSQQVSSSDFVFSGTLVEENNEQLTFKIENIWKGNARDKITFRYLHNVTKRNVSKDEEREYLINDCDYIFKLGESYIVYARVLLQGVEVNKCGRTGLLNKAQRDIEELNRQNHEEILSIFNFALLPKFF